MGYESKIYVVRKSSREFMGKQFRGRELNGKEMWYAEVIASFNLCKVYAVSDKMRKYPATDVYFYADDGNTEIVEDPYGEPLKEVPIDKAIEIIAGAAEKDDYWRYAPTLAALRAFQDIGCEDIVVLHYGY